jgi:hypothetical protein
MTTNNNSKIIIIIKFKIWWTGLYGEEIKKNSELLSEIGDEEDYDNLQW